MRAATAALRAALTASPKFAAPSKVYDGRAVTDTGEPISGSWYVVIQPAETDDIGDRLSGRAIVQKLTTVFQCVGSTPEQAQGVVDDLDAVLRPSGRGLRLEVPGWSFKPLRRDYVSGVQIDKDASPPIWYQTVEYSHRSQPTT